ncbi:MULTISPECIES: cupin domain-containing protein [Cupriavidus]
MTNHPSLTDDIRRFQVPMTCTDLAGTMAFFTDRLGFRIDAIFPADSPRTAILSGHGLTLWLTVGTPERGVRELHLLCGDPDRHLGGQRELIAPNGVVIRLAHADPPMRLPPTRQELVLSPAAGNVPWSVGRAGLRYRDLLPNRHGGAFIASHIRILDGGPVPDYVHYHKIRFQTIFCRKGWVRVVYEGQGEPFVLNPGDCVLQPPEIRHRVLESSPGAEVIELGSPSEHITMADHQMTLPTARYPGDHDFGGQRFVRHVASQGKWQPWSSDGFLMADTGIGAATNGLAGVRVVRPEHANPDAARCHATEFCFFFVLSGALTVEHDGGTHPLRADDSLTIPGGLPYRLSGCTADLELLEVTLPDAFGMTGPARPE